MISHDPQNLQGTDYTVRTKVFLERLLDFELRGPEDRSLFYEDPSPSFPRLLFLGQEWSLWQLELLVFAFVDMLATDYVTAAVVTAVITGVYMYELSLSLYSNMWKPLNKGQFGDDGSVLYSNVFLLWQTLMISRTKCHLDRGVLYSEGPFIALPHSFLLHLSLSLSLSWQVVSVIREVLSRRNLANKTLVDRRFLI